MTSENLQVHVIHKISPQTAVKVNAMFLILHLKSLY